MSNNLSGGYYFFASKKEKDDAEKKLIESIKFIVPENEKKNENLFLNYINHRYLNTFFKKQYFINLVLKAYSGPSLFRKSAAHELVERLNNEYSEFKIYAIYSKNISNVYI